MYRPQIKVFDCTIRDGGLMNNSKFPIETVRGVYNAACRAGLDYVELGYRNSKELLSPEEFGPWRFCDEEDLRRATDGIDPGSTKVSIMMDAHKSNPEDLLPADESVAEMMRCATYVKDIDKAIHLVNHAREKGYETTINIMAISHEGGIFLREALQQIENETQVDAVYIVDSFGALYSETVHYLIEMYQQYLNGKQVGGHFHNSQQLAFANTIESIIKGANYVDGTLYGLGRASGNCPLEMLLGFLKNPKFNIVPILDAVSRYIIPLTDEMDWGYHIPYMLSGVLDRHPSDAMRWMNSERKNDFVAFYREITDQTDE